MTAKSPFLVIQDFIPRNEAISLSKEIRLEPTFNDDGYPTTIEKHNIDVEKPLFEKFKSYMPKIEKHYDMKIRGVEHLLFQQFPVTNEPAEQPQCANSVYKRKKWIKVRDRDLTGVLWLKDYQDSAPFDLSSEVYGGKLEFKVFNFSFQPQAGSLVLFPAVPNFIYATSKILVGELQVVRFNIAAEGTWLYDPKNFQGDYTTWFNDVV